MLEQKTESDLGWAWCCTLVILESGRLRQEREIEFKASLDYIARLCKNEQPLGHRQEGRL